MTVSATFERVLEWARANHFCQAFHVKAIDGAGRSVPVASVLAIGFCAFGLLERAAHANVITENEAGMLKIAIPDAFGRATLSFVNDNHTEFDQMLAQLKIWEIDYPSYYQTWNEQS